MVFGSVPCGDCCMQLMNWSGGSAGSVRSTRGAVTVTCGVLVDGVVGASLALAGAALSAGGLPDDWPFWFELGTWAPAAVPARSQTESCHQNRRRMAYSPSFIGAADAVQLKLSVRLRNSSVLTSCYCLPWCAKRAYAN
jgi:hypothetical protein